MIAKLAKNTGCRKFAITPPISGTMMSPKVITSHPAHSPIQAIGFWRKIAKASPSQRAPLDAGTSATRIVESINRARSFERVFQLAPVRDVVLEEAAREGVVLLDGHVRFAREVVVAQAPEPRAQRRPP